MEFDAKDKIIPFVAGEQATDHLVEAVTQIHDVLTERGVELPIFAGDTALEGVSAREVTTNQEPTNTEDEHDNVTVTPVFFYGQPLGPPRRYLRRDRWGRRIYEG